MTCARAINLARRHAALCDEIERCAPAVTAPYLQAAYDRMKLPVTVKCFDVGHLPFEIHFRTPRKGPGHIVFARGPQHAAQRYFEVCSTLSDPAPTILPASTGDGAALAGASASASASLSKSAAPTSGASSHAVALGAEPPSASSASISGGC